MELFGGAVMEWNVVWFGLLESCLRGYGPWPAMALRERERTKTNKPNGMERNEGNSIMNELMNEATSQFRKEMNLFIEWRNGVACC